MKKLRDAVVRRWRFARGWVRDGRPLWLWLVVASILFGVPYMFPAAYFGLSADLADRVRWSGILFQFAGLTTVVLGLNRSRQVFERNSLWKAIGQWLGRARFIVRPPKPVGATVALSASAATVSGAGEVRVITSGSSLQDRVRRLEDDVRRLEERLSGTGRDVQRLRGETNERIERERTERQTDDRKISKQIETATIGGIHLEVSGLAYLFGGITFTALPRETAWLLYMIGL